MRSHKQLFSSKNHIISSGIAIIMLIIFLIIPNFIQTNVPHSSQRNNESISVIFDMNGVLTFNAGATKVLNLRKFITYALFNNPFKAQEKIRKKLFEFMDSIEERHPGEAGACDEQGKLVPQIVCNWLKGTENSEQLLERVEKAAEGKTGLEISIIKDIAHMMFVPEQFVQTQQWNEETLAFVRELKDQGCKLYILSNWDPASFKYMRQQYADIFALFDGIMISGDVGLIKPDARIYEHILATFNIPRERVLFIDDQKVNVESAIKNCKICSVVCTPDHGIKRARSVFYTWRDTLAPYNNKCLAAAAA